MAEKTDGGWAWFVALAVFINVMFIDGTFVTFGIVYPHLLSAFGSSPTVTSLTGSLMPAFLLFSSPLAGCLIRRFDCRRVNFVGTCLASFSVLISSTCDHIGTFAVTYGALAGIGIGMISFSGHIMINTYFNKYRGLANGIVASGAGVGVFTMSTLLQQLLDHYSWRGTLLIYSACMLHVCISACLMRPLKETKVESVADQIHNVEDVTQCPVQQTKPLLNPNLKVGNAVLDTQRKNSFLYDTVNINGELKGTFDNLNQYGMSMPELSRRQNENDFMIETNVLSQSQNAIKSNYATDVENLGHRLAVRHIDPIYRKDIFFNGSIYNLKEMKEAGSVEQFAKSMKLTSSIASVEEAEADEFNQEKTCTKLLRFLQIHLMDVSLFKYRIFTPILMAAVLWQMGQFIPSTFLPDYCYSIGLSRGHVTVTMSIFGGMNIFGRLSAGCLANLKAINALWLCAFGNLMCTIVCGLFPLLKTFSLICVYSATFGYFIGFVPALQVLILVEYLGLDKLTSAIGIFQFFKAPAALFGPPLAGLVYQLTADYSMTIVVAAVLFLTATICQILVPIVDKFPKATPTMLVLHNS